MSFSIFLRVLATALMVLATSAALSQSGAAPKRDRSLQQDTRPGSNTPTKLINTVTLPDGTGGWGGNGAMWAMFSPATSATADDWVLLMQGCLSEVDAIEYLTRSQPFYKPVMGDRNWYLMEGGLDVVCNAAVSQDGQYAWQYCTAQTISRPTMQSKAVELCESKTRQTCYPVGFVDSSQYPVFGKRSQAYWERNSKRQSNPVRRAVNAIIDKQLNDNDASAIRLFNQCSAGDWSSYQEHRRAMGMPR